MYENDQLYVSGVYFQGEYDTPSLKFGSCVVGKGAAEWKAAKMKKRHSGMEQYTAPIHYVYDNFVVYITDITRNWLRNPKRISFTIYSISENKIVVKAQDMKYSNWVRDFVSDKMYFKTWFGTKEGNLEHYINL